MAKRTTREEYEAFRKKWNAAYDRLRADRPVVVLDLAETPPWREAEVDFDEGVDVEFDDAEESGSDG